MGRVALHSSYPYAWLRQFYHLGHSLIPEIQAVEGHLLLVGGAAPVLAPLLWCARLGQHWAPILRGKGAMGRGTCPLSSRPAPPVLPLQSSAPGSRACRGTLHPQARLLTHLPGPGTCSPRNAREFSEDFISQGLREPQNSLNSVPGKTREK